MPKQKLHAQVGHLEEVPLQSRLIHLEQVVTAYRYLQG